MAPRPKNRRSTSPARPTPVKGRIYPDSVLLHATAPHRLVVSGLHDGANADLVGDLSAARRWHPVPPLRCWGRHPREDRLREAVPELLCCFLLAQLVWTVVASEDKAMNGVVVQALSRESPTRPMWRNRFALRDGAVHPRLPARSIDIAPTVVSGAPRTDVPRASVVRPSSVVPARGVCAPPLDSLATVAPSSLANHKLGFPGPAIHLPLPKASPQILPSSSEGEPRAVDRLDTVLGVSAR